MKNSSRCCLLVLACFAEGIKLSRTSVKSRMFLPLRANKKPAIVEDCGEQITEPYGILQHEHEKGDESTEKCTWRLRAPESHVLNVISNEIVVRAETSISTSITLYNVLNVFDLGSLAHAGAIVTYEFLSVDDMCRLLREDSAED